MKVKINSKKGLKTSLSVLVDKKTIQKKMDEKLVELQNKVHLKGFRPGKVPPKIIQKQFGKAIYGEVIDGILKESSAKAIQDNKIKVAGQPKIDLKTFGEGKDLDYTIELETLPEIKLKSLDNIKGIDYNIKVESEEISKRLKEIADNQKNFTEKKDIEKAIDGDLVVFDYLAKVEGKPFEGNEGKNIQLVLGKDLFIKGFDTQLIGSQKNQIKNVSVKLPENYPKKELANKKADFECKIINIKSPSKVNIDDELAKKVGAKDLQDLKILISKQISSQYKNALDAITKKNILEQLDNNYTINLPKNLVEQETKILNQNLKKEDIEKNKDKNDKLAKTRIKVGLILNEIGEKNKLKINESEIQNEIRKHVSSMPGQEKMVMEYYQKNPSAVASLRGSLYEDKILELIKSKINLSKRSVSLKEAEDLIKGLSKNTKSTSVKKKQEKSKNKKKK